MVDLVAKARWVRQQLFEMVVRTGRGPLPSCYSMIEILVALYYGVKRPEDVVIISKGHAGIAVYPILADLGLLEPNELETYAQPGSRLCMYAEPRVPGITIPCASLGIGFGVAAVMAFADRSRRIFAILGDAECYEGSVWETMLWAAHHHLTNLVAIVDRNFHGVMCRTEDAVRQEPLGEKWRAFGWIVEECLGHDFRDIQGALKCVYPSPLVVIAKTTKAKGLSFWENVPNVHSAILSEEQKAQARKELYAPA